MRNQFWYMWAETKRKERYYIHYQGLARILNAILTLSCCVAATFSLINWGVWGTVPLVWSVVAAASQFVQVANPIFPFSKQLVAFRFLLPYLSNALILIESDWNKLHYLGVYSETDIEGLIQKWQSEVDNMISSYVGNTWMPPIERFADRAEDERDTFMDHKRGHSEKEVYNARPKTE